VISDFHAKYFAYEITKRCSSESVEKLTAVLADAQVDLNPHQIEAARFTFRSPFSKSIGWPQESQVRAKGSGKGTSVGRGQDATAATYRERV